MSMTRQALLDIVAEQCSSAREHGYAVADLVEQEWVNDAYYAATEAARAADSALTHIAALEQQAITDHLADVPLLPGWREEPSMYGETNYVEAAEGLYEVRVMASRDGVRVWSTPAHWPAIPQAVLIRAAVMCHRLREAK